MRHLTAVVLAAMIFGAFMQATPAQAEHHRAWRWHECRYQGLDGHMGFTRREVRKTIRCASHKFDVSTSTALYVADRESDFRDGVVNTSSGAAGVYQHIPRYFASRLRAVPNRFKPLSRSIFNGRSNTLAALWMARHGWAPWGM